MIDRLKKAKIEDIAVEDLIFYEPMDEKKLSDFCFRNSISYLPSKDRKSVYALTLSGFVNEPLNPDFCINPDELLFDEKTADQFKKVDHNEIRFVVKNGLVTGVVHIVDYNNEFIAVEIYRAFFRFENNLRQLLIQNGLGNEHFIKWVRMNRDCEVNDPKNSCVYWKDKYAILMPSDCQLFLRADNSRRMVYPFQTFYLADLLEFSFDQNILTKSMFQPRIIKSLRNFTAHNRHFVSIAESESGQLVYDFKHLKEFITNINVFLNAYEILESKLCKIFN